METPIIKILCLISLIVFSTFLHPSLSELCNPEDKKALLQIKQALNNPSILASWDPQTDCCDWLYVQCNDNHRINSIIIENGKLEGPIPPQVGNLPYLKVLEFITNPKLTGPIPPTIAKLKRLQFFRISKANITGPIPEFIAEMKSLKSVEISSARLTGQILSSLSGLSNLTELNLNRNLLTGPIPSSFGEFKGEYFFLDLSRNKLLGKIPASLGKRTFDVIDLSWNRLEGDVSLLFGPKKSTWKVDLSMNSFEFDISNVEFAKSLEFLDINHNKIFGRLPEGLTQLSLVHFNVSYNRLTGEIPQGGDLQKFDASAYRGNDLCGPPLSRCDVVTAL